MDITEETTSNEGRVTRSRRKRLVSIESDTSSRPSTPVMNVKMEADALPKRITRRNSITKTPQKTPSTSKDISIIDLATPSKSTRRLSQLITDLDTPQKLKPQTPLTVLPEEDTEDTKTNKETKNTKVEKYKTRSRQKKITQCAFDSDDAIEIIDISNQSDDTIEEIQTEAATKPIIKHEAASNTNLNTSPNKLMASIETLGTPSKGTRRISQIQGQIDSPKIKNNTETPSKTAKLKTNVENNEKIINRKSVVRLERITQVVDEIVIDGTKVSAEKNEKQIVDFEKDGNQSFAGFEEDENANKPSFTPSKANFTNIDKSPNKPLLSSENDTPHAKVIDIVIIPTIEDNVGKVKSPQKEECDIDTSNLSKSTNEQNKSSMHSKSVTFENGDNLDESKVSFPKTPAIRKNSSMASAANKRSLKLSDSVMEVDDHEYENTSSNTSEEHDKENKNMTTAEISFSKKSNTPQKSQLDVFESHCSTPNVPKVDNAVELKTPTPEKFLRSDKTYSPSPAEEGANQSKENEFENINQSSLHKSNNSKIDGDENEVNINVNTDAINSIGDSVQNKSMEYTDNSLQTISNLDSTKGILQEEEANSNSKDNELENHENLNEEAIKAALETEKEDENENEKKDRSIGSNENNTAIENENEGEMSCVATNKKDNSKVQENKISYSRTWMQSIKNSSTKIDTLSSINEKSLEKAKEINEEKFDYRLKLKEDSDDSDANEEIDEEEIKREDNELIDDEAIDMGNSYQSGDSMNQEEKEYATEYFEIDDGESIGSKDTTDEEQEDDNKDDNSFIVHTDDEDDEMKMLQYSDEEEHLNETPETGKVYKRVRKLSSDSEDENADALTYDVTHMIDDTLPNQYEQYNTIENEEAQFSNDEIDDDNEKEEKDKKNEEEETNNRRRSRKTSLIHSNEKETKETEEVGKQEHNVKKTTPNQKQRLSRNVDDNEKEDKEKKNAEEEETNNRRRSRKTSLIHSNEKENKETEEVGKQEHNVKKTTPKQKQRLSRDFDDNEKEEKDKMNEEEETNNRRRSRKTSLIHPNEKESKETKEVEKGEHNVKQTTTPKQKQRVSRSFEVKDKGKREVGGEKSAGNEYDKEYSMTDETSQQSEEEDTCLNNNNDENAESNKTDDSTEDKSDEDSEEIQRTNVNSNYSDRSGNEDSTNNKSIRYSLLIESEEDSPAKEKGNKSAKKHRRSINDEHDIKSNVEEHSIKFNRSRNNSLSANESRRSRKISVAESNGFEETCEQNVSLHQSKERESEQENSADNSSKENNFDNAEKKIIHRSQRHSDLQYKPNKKRADKAMGHKSLNEAEHAVLLGNILSAKKKSKSRNTVLMESADCNLENDDANKNEANDIELEMENNSDDSDSDEIECRSGEEDNVVERGNKKKAQTMKRQRSKSFIETTNGSFCYGVSEKPRNRSCSIMHPQYSNIDTGDTEIDTSETHMTKKMKLSFEEITEAKTPKIQYGQSKIRKILDRCEQMLQVSENAKKSLRNHKPKKEKKRKSKTVKESHEDVTTSTVDDAKRTALQQALKASQIILTKRTKKNRREQQKSENEENKYASKRLPADVIAAVSSDGESPCKMKKRKKNNSEQSQNKIYKSTCGDLIVESQITPPKLKKSKFEIITTNSGVVRVEPVSPKPKKIKDLGFRESPITPQPTGWKMRQLLNSHGLNQSPVSAGRKRKRQTDRIQKTLEPNNSLPHPTWTKSAGNFKIEKIQPPMKVFKPTTGGATVFGVVALDESNSSGFRKKSRNEAVDTSSSFLSSTERAMNFRQNTVYRENIVREDTKALLRRHRFVR